MPGISFESSTTKGGHLDQTKALLTQTVSVSLLVGGARVHLPIILKQ
jgi:hypothetical protein